jgi:hypothetical protein
MKQPQPNLTYQDWEDYIYIDPQIFGHSVLWLLNYQRDDGAFVETEHYQVIVFSRGPIQ